MFPENPGFSYFFDFHDKVICEPETTSGKERAQKGKALWRTGLDYGYGYGAVEKARPLTERAYKTPQNVAKRSFL